MLWWLNDKAPLDWEDLSEPSTKAPVLMKRCVGLIPIQTKWSARVDYDSTMASKRYDWWIELSNYPHKKLAKLSKHQWTYTHTNKPYDWAGIRQSSILFTTQFVDHYVYVYDAEDERWQHNWSIHRTSGWFSKCPIDRHHMSNVSVSTIRPASSTHKLSSISLGIANKLREMSEVSSMSIHFSTLASNGSLRFLCK